MAVDISRAFTFGRRIFDSIVCVYQMPDRAWVDKRSQKVHVRMTKMEILVPMGRVRVSANF